MPPSNSLRRYGGWSDKPEDFKASTRSTNGTGANFSEYTSPQRSTSEPRCEVGEPAWRQLYEQRLQAPVEARQDCRRGRQDHDPQGQFTEISGSDGAAAPSGERFARQAPDRQQRQGGAKTKHHHRQGHFDQTASLRGEGRRGTECGANAGAPRRSQQQPEHELAGKSLGIEAGKGSIGNVTHARSEHSEPFLQ